MEEPLSDCRVLAFAGFLVAALSCFTPAEAHDPCRTEPAACSEATGAGYVGLQGGQFVLGTQRFRFVGTNAYFMFDAASYGSDPHVWEMMHLANDNGFGVLRMWGFMNADGYGNNNGTVDQRLLQPLPWVYNDGGSHTNPWTLETVQTVRDEFRHLDYVLATANAHHVKGVVTLGNNWKEYGGIDQYLNWCPRNVALADRKPIHFYTSPDCRDLYKGYITYLLNRTNSINGRIYREDPTIFAWELMNEPRCQGCPTGAITAWVGEMARHIKTTLGAKQLVATGEEGFDCTKTGPSTATGYTDARNIRWHPWMYDGSQGLCFAENTKLVDFASFHMWPESWRLATESEALWISDHINIAKAAGKPAVFGEFGSTRRDRATRFDRWLDAALIDGDGALVWQLICPICDNHATRLEVIFPPMTSESTTLCTQANRVNASSASCTPAGPYPTQ